MTITIKIIGRMRNTFGARFALFKAMNIDAVPIEPKSPAIPIPYNHNVWPFQMSSMPVIKKYVSKAQRERPNISNIVRIDVFIYFLLQVIFIF